MDPSGSGKIRAPGLSRAKRFLDERQGIEARYHLPGRVFPCQRVRISGQSGMALRISARISVSIQSGSRPR